MYVSFRFTENYKEGKESFGDKIKVQFEEASRNGQDVDIPEQLPR